MRKKSTDAKSIAVLRNTLYVFPDSVCAVNTFVNHSGSLLLIQQFRPLHGRYTWELPGGRVEAGESAAVAALRELEEEAGIIGQEKKYLLKLDLDFSASKHCTHLVHTVSDMPEYLKADQRVITVSEGWEEIQRGEISHAPTVAAILLIMSGGLVYE